MQFLRNFWNRGGIVFRRAVGCVFGACLVFSLAALPVTAAAEYDILLRGGKVVDGSGNPWVRADVAIAGDRIVAIGDLAGAGAVRVIDVAGLYVAPGFIDTHSHAGGGLARESTSSAHALLAQGITTVFVNPDGGGPVNLAGQRENLLEHGLGVNAALMIGHGSVRRAVMGMADREPDDSELQEMRDLVRAGMEAGAFALSSGVFYAPGSYARTPELIELSKVAAEYGGAYQSHIRDESDYTIGVVASVDEVIEVAREAGLPGIVTHIKVLGPRVWGYSAALVHRIDRARDAGIEVWADQYPYIASSTGLASALVPRWAQEGGRSAFLDRMADAETRARIREEMIDNLDRRGGPERIQISRTQNSDIRGTTLAGIAELWGKPAIEVAMALLEEESPGIISYNMHERDVERLMRQPWTMTASDGGLPVFGQGLPHPRAYGSFPRRIREYTLERGVTDLAMAIRAMTHLPASVYHVKDRGIIREGAFADLVVFDIERINDPATFEEPHQLAQGMVYVLVNGGLAVDAGEFGEKLHGRVLRR